MEKTNVYVIYNNTTDIDHLVTSDIKEALIECGELIDQECDDKYIVYVYNNTTIDQYNTTILNFNDDFSVRDFVAGFSPFHLKETVIDIPDKETYHNLDEAEQIEVLHFISDKMLIDEVLRRFQEYRKATDKAYDALESMLIYK